MAKLKGLGRGLDALLSGNDSRSIDTLSELAVGMLRPGRFQPRTRMDPQSIAELADSIRSQGLIQPILVRPVEGGKYEIIAGERRWRAAQLAGLTQVPVVMRERQGGSSSIAGTPGRKEISPDASSASGVPTAVGNGSPRSQRRAVVGRGMGRCGAAGSASST